MLPLIINTSLKANNLKTPNYPQFPLILKTTETLCLHFQNLPTNKITL